MNAEYNPPNEFFGSNRGNPDLGIACYVHPLCVIGYNTKIWHFAVIQRDVVIGNHCSIGSHAEISAGGNIGSNVRIGHGTITAPSMKIEDNVFIGPNVTFCDDDRPVVGNTTYVRRPPTVLAGASIGAGAVIMPGVTVGRQAMVGAGALVLYDVPDFATVYTKAETIIKQP